MSSDGLRRTALLLAASLAASSPFACNSPVAEPACTGPTCDPVDGGTDGSDAFVGSDGVAPDGLSTADADPDAPPPDDAGDGPGQEAASDSATTGSDAADAGVDGPPPGPPVCGDGWRDVATEECDDGASALPDDSCTSDCRVRDVLPVPGVPPAPGIAPPGRKLGEGRHPLAAGPGGVAVVFEGADSPSVGLKVLDSVGAPLAGVVDVAAGANPALEANPVVAALPNGSHVVAWNDLGIDGDELGVGIRSVAATGALGGLKTANASTLFAQMDPDILWTGSELVVVWTDWASGTSDVRLRRFDEKLNPLAPPGEQTLAGSAAFEDRAVLAVFNGDWAAAYRINDSGGETIAVRTPTGSWSIGPFLPGATEDRPGLVELDATHLLVVFTLGSTSSASTVSRLAFAIVDTTSFGSPQALALEPLAAPYASLPELVQRDPTAVRVGARVYVGWRSGAIPGQAQAEELWLKALSWDEATATLDLSAPEIALPRQSTHASDDQRHGSLAGAPLWPEGALVAAWDDYGRVFGPNEGAPDVVFELLPLPILRLPDQDGGS